jgi:hypothetical protein
MRKDVITLKLATTPSSSGGDLDRRYQEPGVTILANVSAPETVPATIAEQGVAILRARVMCSQFVAIAKGWGAFWQGRIWVVAGPMVPESKAQDGTVVNYTFNIEAVA